MSEGHSFCRCMHVVSTGENNVAGAMALGKQLVRIPT